MKIKIREKSLVHSLERFRDCFGFRTQKDIEGIYLHKKFGYGSRDHIWLLIWVEHFLLLRKSAELKGLCHCWLVNFV